jgi:hypothetical protein
MKSLTKLTFLAATAAVLGTTSAFGDDPHLRTQLAIQRAQMEREQPTTTIALYARGRSVGARERVNTTRDFARASEDRPVVMHRGRGESVIVRPAAR